MSKKHTLKCLADFWDAVADGTKTFEIRENDRGYQTGDVLVLERYVPGESSAFKRQVIIKRITYVLSGWGIEKGYVALGLSAENGPFAARADREGE